MFNISNLPLSIVILIVFAALTLSSEIGYFIGKNIIKKLLRKNSNESIDENQSTITNASLGLLALFLGFTFSSALDHFEKNRNTIINEVTAISSFLIYERNLPTSETIKIDPLVEKYIKTRIYRDSENQTEGYVHEKQATSEKIFEDISSNIVQFIKNNPNQNLNSGLISTLIEVNKSQIERSENLLNGVPKGLFVPVGLFLLFNGIIMGISLSDGKSRHTFITLGLYFLIALAVGIIIDLDRPLKGFIDVEQTSLELLLKNK